MAKAVPTAEQALEAEQWLTDALEKGGMHKPLRSTLRYSPIRGGGFAWLMQGDEQTYAYYNVPPLPRPAYGKVTYHGHDRMKWRELEAQYGDRPTLSPFKEWYDYRQRYEMDRITRI